MKKKIIYISIAIVVLFLVFVFVKNKNANLKLKGDIKQEIQLPAVDVSNIEPHIMTEEDYEGDINIETGRKELKPEYKKIEDQIKDLLAVKDPNDQEYNNNLGLMGISKDFAVITIFRPTGAGAIDELVNLKTGEIEPLGSGIYKFTTNKAFVYVDYIYIRYYLLGADNSIILEGSTLGSGETYNVWGDMVVSARETHTNESINIDIFDSNTIIGEADQGNQQYKKLRTETFIFPK